MEKFITTNKSFIFSHVYYTIYIILYNIHAKICIIYTINILSKHLRKYGQLICNAVDTFMVISLLHIYSFMQSNILRNLLPPLLYKFFHTSAPL